MHNYQKYEHLQNEWLKINDIKIGDTITVTYCAKQYQLGWPLYWKSDMTNYVGNKYTIEEIKPDGIRLYQYWFPFFVLEKTVKQKECICDLEEGDMAWIEHSNIRHLIYVYRTITTSKLHMVSLTKRLHMWADLKDNKDRIIKLLSKEDKEQMFNLTRPV